MMAAVNCLLRPGFWFAFAVTANAAFSASAPAAAAQTKSAAQTMPAAQAAPDDAAVRRAWELLTPAEQSDALEEYEARAEYAEGFRQSLVRYALRLDERDPGLYPPAAPIPHFDPQRHAPGQPIARRALDPDSRDARAERERILGKLHARAQQPGWVYDYTAREVVLVPTDKPIARRFENALAGMLPRQDLAEALVERALDDGAEQKALTAFAHAYTDRVGTLFPGITLYDAWSSGADLEMPDVDVLGVVHDVLDEWSKWKAPVPESQHRVLYEKVGSIFQGARRHRGLRAAYARSYLCGARELEPLYAVCVERLNFAWESCSSDPATLAKTLPRSADWNEHLAKLEERLLKSEESRAKAQSRWATIEREAAQLREMWVGILRERKAFERTTRPADDK
jgi:hypothetical protein